jgi:hypothetical protein
LPLAIEDTFSFGAVIYAALAIAHAEEPSARRELVQAALIALLRGLRSHPLPRNIGAAEPTFWERLLAHDLVAPT